MASQSVPSHVAADQSKPSHTPSPFNLFNWYASEDMPDGTSPIPSPPTKPLVGNGMDLDTEFPLGSLINWAEQYGEIFRLHFPGGRTNIFVTTQALVHEVCDEKRFQKSINPVLKEVRNGVHDGLFTAYAGETNWGMAHRILMPAFGPMSIQSMFGGMHELATQLALKWARQGPNAAINVPDDMTRMTLDTLALCTFNYRFNSYYREDMHPFLDAMGSFLHESGDRSRRPGFTSVFYRATERKYFTDIEVMRKTAMDVVQERKAHPETAKKDLLQAMLDGVDKQTGLKLDDEAIVNNMITFLIAGHETTAGLLAFAFYNLINNPEAYRKVQEEVDRVLGTGPIKIEHVNKLPYIAAVMRETLRLSAPIAAFSLEPKEDTLLGGKYPVKKGEPITALLAKMQKDPAVYGATANDFVPERMLDEPFERLQREFPDSWKPFGNGIRGCIGRPFAWQEVLLLLGLLFQNFNFVQADPAYTLKLKQTLTIKPKDFYIRAILRDGLTPAELEARLAGAIITKDKKSAAAQQGKAKTATKGNAKPLNIYYGSNTGTCEALAQRLASDAAAHGFVAEVVDPLDMAYQNLPKDRPAVIITASYEGSPADNAALFVEWIQNVKAKEMEGVSYAVFGCGHHDWAQTFHKIPKLINSTLETLGATRDCAIGLTDTANGDIFTDFETWEDEIFWPAMEAKYGTSSEVEHDSEAFSPGLSLAFSTPRSAVLRQDVKPAIVIENKTLSTPGVPQKNHVEVQLPSDMPYTAGDYLAVLPLNPSENVSRAIRRFNLAWDAYVTIDSSSAPRTSLPTGQPVSVSDLLSSYVELAQPATRRSLGALSVAASDTATQQALQALAEPDTYQAEVLAKRASVLDLVERFPGVALPFGTFLALLPPMRVRQYSISSSPLWNPARATLTFSVVDAPSLADPNVRYAGVATTYLSGLKPGDRLHVGIRSSHKAFHLPVEPEKTPVIMIATGTGIAPFRGFVQERAAQIAAGRKLAPAMLFFGCRGPAMDDLYRAELDAWQKAGAVDVRRAYSRVDLDAPEAKDAAGCRHVDDRLWRDREDVVGSYDAGARVYVCGSREVGEAVRKVLIKMAKEAREKKGMSAEEEEVERWFEGIRNERYATDVFD